MIEGGLAPFETPFFFILIDPSKGSWRQLAAAGPFFLGLEALPCGARGFMRGWRSLHPPFWALLPAPRGDLCRTGGPSPTNARRTDALLCAPPHGGASSPGPCVTFSPMRKSPKNLPEGRPLWVLPLGALSSPQQRAHVCACCSPQKGFVPLTQTDLPL